MSEAITNEQRAGDYACKECGALDNPAKWLGGEKIAASGYCFSCKHWADLLAIKDRSDVVRVNGTHYMLGTARSPGRYNGFGGHRFKIRFHDGREVETVDLWCQGSIPDRWWARMPDNAAFVEGMGRHDNRTALNRSQADGT